MGFEPVKKVKSEDAEQFVPAFKIPNDLIASHSSLAQSHSQQLTAREALGRTAQIARPMIEGTGAAAGGIIGAASPLPGGSLMGGGLGYGIGKKIADIIEEQSGVKVPDGLVEQFLQSAQDVATGAAYQAAGESAIPAISLASKGVSAVARPLLGKLSGVGSGGPELALAGGEAFKKALRGNITPEEIVSNFKDAVSLLKDQRLAAYQNSLSKITQNTADLDTKPIIKKTVELMQRYNVNMTADGAIDTSRIAMGQAGRKDIKELLENVMKWGKEPGDKTALGLDTLKRQLDDFYSDSSQARQFVTALRNSVKDTISKQVPEYAEMTKGYAEATQLIKDIETGLMTRKNGMTGRVTADMTLRRLVSAMKENFTLRRELVDVLGQKTGEDLAGQIAGYAMSELMPRGLSGTGPAILGQAAFATFNPKFWPVLAASSPRVQGEFLQFWGKAMREASAIPATAAQEAVKQSLIYTNQEE